MSAENSDDKDLLQSLIAEILDTENRGEMVDRDSFLAEHPEHADSLREFFASHDQMKSAADVDSPTLPPRSSGPASEDPTIAFGETPLDDRTLPPTEPSGDDATLPPTEGKSQPSEATVGDQVRYFGDYELLEEIARGGMGVVYKARQKNLNRTVALKMILAGQFAGEEDVQRFYTEAEAAASLDHPGIVPIFEIGEHAGQHYFSMGYIEGESLADRLRDGPLPPREAAEMIVKICDAVAYAHDKGVIHRDLKPGNVLIDEGGTPKITDFGLAKQIGGDSELTRSGQIIGTPSYMPPEQASGQVDEINASSDVYSLGAILYCLVTGRPPFQSDNALDTLLQVLEETPLPPRSLNRDLPQDVETICMKCLQKNPRLRYQSARSLATDLNLSLRGKAIESSKSVPSRLWDATASNPLVVAFLIVGVLIAIVSVVMPDRLAGSFDKVLAKDLKGERRIIAHTTATCFRLFLGMAVGLTCGLAMGFMFQQYRFTKAALLPVLRQLQSPKLASVTLFFIVPFLFLFLGTREALFVLPSAVIVGIAIATSFANAPPRYSLRARDSVLLRSVTNTVTSLRNAFPIALVYILIAEYTLGDAGIGYEMRVQARGVRVGAMIPYFVIGLLIAMIIDFWLASGAILVRRFSQEESPARHYLLAAIWVAATILCMIGFLLLPALPMLARLVS